MEWNNDRDLSLSLTLFPLFVFSRKTLPEFEFSPDTEKYSSSFSYLSHKQDNITAITVAKNETNSKIENCENDGILIENMCICLNQFHGLRCEKAPDYGSSVKEPKKSFNSNNFIMSRIISKTNFNTSKWNIIDKLMN